MLSFFTFLKYSLFPPKEPEEIAKRITEKIAQSSFSFFKNTRFRDLLDFQNLSQIEQDRIFNELVVTGQSAAILMFETLEQRAKTKTAAQFYRDLQIEIESRYSNWLKELGVEPEHFMLWKKLVKMRTQEYRKTD